MTEVGISRSAGALFTSATTVFIGWMGLMESVIICTEPAGTVKKAGTSESIVGGTGTAACTSISACALVPLRLAVIFVIPTAAGVTRKATLSLLAGSSRCPTP